MIFSSYVFIGIGNHAINTLMPSIPRNKISIISTNNSQYKNYISIESIPKKIKQKSLFVISTPPKTHYRIIIKLISNNVQFIYVEKPSVLKQSQALSVTRLIKKKNIIFVEMYMYLYTKMYKKFYSNFSKNRTSIKLMNIKFIIPNLKYISFRDNDDFKDSFFFDMGCYPFSLFHDLKIEIPDRKNIIFKKSKNQIHFSFKSDKTTYKIHFGYGKKYHNSIQLVSNKLDIIYNNFFYGKKKEKTILFKNLNSFELIQDINAFSKMFKFQNHSLANHSQISLRRMNFVSRQFDYFIKFMD